MYSVTQRVEMIKQPKSGYLKTGLFVKEQYNDDIQLNNNELVDPSIAGMVVDYLTRTVTVAESAKDAFRISLLGATKLDFYRNTHDEIKKAIELVNEIKGLDDQSIINACHLACYDVCLRVSWEKYRSLGIEPDKYTISNIRTMVQRSIDFFNREGPLIRTNITFENGGYTDIISSGDADYLTETGLWDMKVSKHELNAQYTLQLLVYYLMGLRIDNETFNKVTKIGFFNPRQNLCYWIDVSFIPDSVISLVSREVIGYTE